jgi:hypothetical protein
MGASGVPFHGLSGSLEESLVSRNGSSLKTARYKFICLQFAILGGGLAPPDEVEASAELTNPIIGAQFYQNSTKAKSLEESHNDYRCK